MRRRYRKPFLKQVIVRIDFKEIYEALEFSMPKELEDIIKEIFPLAETKEILSNAIKIKKNEGVEEFEKIEQKITQWRFRKRNIAQTLTIDTTTMHIALNKYESYDKLRNDFMSIVHKLFDINPYLRVSRLGLRYINNIELKENRPTAWSSYLNSNLLAIFKIPSNKDHIARAFQNLVLNDGDVKLNFQYGMHNPDYPAQIKKKVFILDYDCYYEGTLEDSVEVQRYLTKCHDMIEDIFENCLKNPLRELMEVIDDE